MTLEWRAANIGKPGAPRQWRLVQRNIAMLQVASFGMATPSAHRRFALRRYRRKSQHQAYLTQASRSVGRAGPKSTHSRTPHL